MDQSTRVCKRKKGGEVMCAESDKMEDDVVKVESPKS